MEQASAATESASTTETGSVDADNGGPDFYSASGVEPTPAIETKAQSPSKAALGKDHPDNAQPRGLPRAAPEAKPQEDLEEANLDKLVTLTVDGKNHRMTVREAIKLQQLERVSRTKINQAASKESQIKEFLQRLDNPEEYFRFKGIDPVEFAESTLKTKLQLLQETPEQREMRELKDYRARTEAEREQIRQAQVQEHQLKEEQEHQGRFNSEFVEAWKTTGLPADRLFGQFLAAEMVSANSRGDDLSWNQAAVTVKTKFEKALGSVFSQMDPEGILRVIGPEVARKLREYEVSRVSNGTSPTPNSGPRPNGRGPQLSPLASKGSGKPAKLNEREWSDWWKNS